MKKFYISLAFIGLVSQNLSAQMADSINPINTNFTSNFQQNQNKLTIGGYAQIDYNQPIGNPKNQNGTLDVHRLVMLFGYKFNQRAQFVTEIEFEHVSEVYVEQAFLDYKINPYMTFRGGLVLIPMGIINEYHEPPTFNGVERPQIDNKIAPTTWREIGLGFTGLITNASLKYQAYLVNGFNGYSDGTGHLTGSNAFRSGRQKGAESYMSSPNYTTKVEYFGVRSLNLGLSGYFGKTQSELYKMAETDAEIASADSSVVGLAMFGFDARYTLKALQLRGQVYYSSISNTNQYNTFTGNDLGSSNYGYYVEAGYNVFQHFNNVKSELIPFVRYEGYNTQASMEGTKQAAAKNNVTFITAGLGWKITPQASLKADIEFKKSEADAEYLKTFNAGVAVMF